MVYQKHRCLFPDYGVVREGVIAENSPQMSAKVPQTFRRISTPLPDAINLFFSQFLRIFHGISANFLQKPRNVNFWPDFWVEFWEVNFSRVNFLGAFLLEKKQNQKFDQEFGSRIRASKTRFPEFDPRFGFRRCKNPCAEVCP